MHTEKTVDALHWRRSNGRHSAIAQSIRRRPAKRARDLGGGIRTQECRERQTTAPAEQLADTMPFILASRSTKPMGKRKRQIVAAISRLQWI